MTGSCEAVTYPLPMPNGSTVLVTVHWRGRDVVQVDCPTWQELWAICTDMGRHPLDIARDYTYRSKLRGASARLRGAARLWTLVCASAPNPVRDREIAERHALEAQGITRTTFGDRTGD